LPLPAPPPAPLPPPPPPPPPSLPSSVTVFNANVSAGAGVLTFPAASSLPPTFPPNLVTAPMLFQRLSASLQRRKLKLKAKIESSSSYFSFKR